MAICFNLLQVCTLKSLSRNVKNYRGQVYVRHCDVTQHENVIRIYTKFCRSLTFVISKRANIQTVFVFFVRS